jgi:hypothetical protein
VFISSSSLLHIPTVALGSGAIQRGALLLFYITNTTVTFIIIDYKLKKVMIMPALAMPVIVLSAMNQNNHRVLVAVTSREPKRLEKGHPHQTQVWARSRVKCSEWLTSRAPAPMISKSKVMVTTALGATALDESGAVVPGLPEALGVVMMISKFEFDLPRAIVARVITQNQR